VWKASVANPSSTANGMKKDSTSATLANLYLVKKFIAQTCIAQQ
jgi:hypothetical protein